MKKLSLKPHQIDKSINFESWFYEDEGGIEVYSTRYPQRSVGRISKRKLLGVLSRIYQVDFSKYIKEKK
jgi:hypothetical protein